MGRDHQDVRSLFFLTPANKTKPDRQTPHVTIEEPTSMRVRSTSHTTALEDTVA
jgi:hypothetical protein